MTIFLIIIFTIIFLCILYHIISVFVEKNKTHVLTHKESLKIKKKLKTMSPRQYEVFCSNLFSSLGYKVLITKASNDGGKDIVLKKFNKVYYVECKCYNVSQVSRPVAQKLVGALVGDKLPPKHGIIITTSSFSKGCKEYAAPVGVKLIDLNETLNLLSSLSPKKRREII